MNSRIYEGSIHVAPRRTSISLASRSLGCACRSASTFGQIKQGVLSRLLRFPQLLPDVAGEIFICCLPLPRAGSRKITPFSSLISSSWLLPVSCAIYAISTQAFSEMDSASASEAVSTLVTASCARMVRLVNISALRLRFCPRPAPPGSRADSRSCPQQRPVRWRGS